MAVTLSTIRSLVAALNGEESTPASTLRDNLINAVIRDIYGRKEWRWAEKTATVTISGTTATLPTDFLILRDLREVLPGVNDDVVYELVELGDWDQYDTGSPVAMIYGNDVDGKTIRINQASEPTLTLTYASGPTDLVNSGDTTPIPNALTVAKGVYALLKRADDPDLDVTGEQAEYEGEVAKLMREDARVSRTSEPRVKGLTERAGHYLGMRG